ncbi:MAG: hypothetical protein ACPGXL_05270, partial [Chitinophagales bacterium]
MIKLAYPYHFYKHYLFLLLVFSFLLLSATPVLLASPFVHNFPKDIYQADRQNWDMAQDNSGVMYFANNRGLLQFDGATWELTSLPYGVACRAVEVDDNNRIYIGADNEFGYFDEGEAYVSLSKSLPNHQKRIGNVWCVLVEETQVIFASYTTLFAWKADSLHVLIENQDLGLVHKIGQDLYVANQEKGLLKFDKTQNQFLPLTVDLPTNWADMTVRSMERLNNQQLLIGTFDHGLWVLDTEVLRPFEVPVNALLKKNQIFCSYPLSNGQIAYGSVQSGLYVIDTTGQLIHHIDESKGLQNNTLLSAFYDRHQNLWLGLDNGIDLVEINAPYATRAAIGAGYAYAQNTQFTYWGTNKGLRYSVANSTESNPTAFPYINGTQGQVWSLYETGDLMLCGHDKGAFLIKGTKARQITNTKGIWNFHPLPMHPNLLISSHYNGLSLFEVEQKNGKTTDVRFLHNIEGFVASHKNIVTYKNQIWMVDYLSSIRQLILSESLDSVVSNKTYDLEKGYSRIHVLDNELILSTEAGVYRFDDHTQEFVINEALSQLFQTSLICALRKDSLDNWWALSTEQLSQLNKNDKGQWQIKQFNVKNLSDNFLLGFESLEIVDDLAILGTDNGFITYDLSINAPQTDFQTLITKVLAFDLDSIEQPRFLTIDVDKPNVIYLPFRQNNIKFQFAATHFSALMENSYQYFLEGFDHNWSAWN